MDFFEEMNRAIARDAARRGVRASADELQAFFGTVQSVPPAAPLPEPVPDCSNLNPPGAVDALLEDAMVEVNAERNIPQVADCSTMEWQVLRETVLACRNCPLAAGRMNAVFGEGNQQARLMFIGEGPGADEDATGRPFVGAAGQLLDKMINAMHLQREEVYIGNIVKCRPPGNRMPGEEEAAACIGYLQRQIELIKPEVIVLLGGTALHFLLGIDGISRCRGRWHEYNNISVMPTFHPAFLLRKPEAKRDAWNDLKAVMKKLNIPV